MSEGRNKDDLKDITLLGNQNNQYYDQYKPEVLEVFRQ